MALKHAEAQLVDACRLIYEVPGTPVAVFDGEHQLGADLAWLAFDWGFGRFQLKAAPAFTVSATYRETLARPASVGEKLDAILRIDPVSARLDGVNGRLDRILALLERRGAA
jgi:hypothetical protein